MPPGETTGDLIPHSFINYDSITETNYTGYIIGNVQICWLLRLFGFQHHQQYPFPISSYLFLVCKAGFKQRKQNSTLLQH